MFDDQISIKDRIKPESNALAFSSKVNMPRVLRHDRHQDHTYSSQLPSQNSHQEALKTPGSGKRRFSAITFNRAMYWMYAGGIKHQAVP